MTGTPNPFAGRVAEVEGERLVFKVQSFNEKTPSQWYRVDILALDGNGACDCPPFRFKMEPEVRRWQRYGLWLRCKHIIRARAYFTDLMLADIRKQLERAARRRGYSVPSDGDYRH